MNNRQKLLFIGLILLLQFTSSAFLSQSLSLQKNTLKNNGRWISTKTTVERFLEGAHSYFEGTQALSGYHLNLASWWGFQEVIYKNQITPRSVAFDFRLSSSSYFYFIFNKDDAGFSGFRIGVNPDYENIYFRSQPTGKFDDKLPLSIDLLQKGSWSKCKVKFASSSVSLAIDGRLIGTFPLAMKSSQRVGFRGSAKEVLIDNIDIEAADAQSNLDESFFNCRIFLWHWLLCFSALAVLSMCFYLVSRRFNPQEPFKPIFRLALISMIVFVLAAAYCPVNYLWFKRYPYENPTLFDFKKHEEDWKENLIKQINGEVMTQYGNENPAGRFRILFLGSSQLWGCGAAVDEDVFVRRVEDILNSENKGTVYECINAGVCGSDSSQLLPYYERNWAGLKPRITIVDLGSSNKMSPQSGFGADLQRIVDINKKNGIMTIFILEPNTTEMDEFHMLPMHAVTKQVAQKNGILVLDAHKYLRDNRGEGIIWWDIDHLTSFGHELMARFVYENIREFIRE